MSDKELVFTIKACSCGVIDEDHHHLDPHTVVPWDVFCAAAEEFKIGPGYSVGSDVVKSISTKVSS